MAYFNPLDDWEEIQNRSARQLPKGDEYVPWGTGLVETAENVAASSIATLQAWSEDDPDKWTDDALRLMGGGLKNVGNTVSDWMERSEEGEIGLRSAAGTALRFMNWGQEKGADVGGATIQMLGGNEQLGRFAGGMVADALMGGVAGKAAKVGRVAGMKQLMRTNLPGSQMAKRGMLKHYMAKAPQIRKQMARQGGYNVKTPGAQGMTAHYMETSVPTWHVQYNKLTTDAERLKFLKTTNAVDLKSNSVKGGKITANKLVKDPEMMQKLMDRADQIVDDFYKGDQRLLYDNAAQNILGDSANIYHNQPLRRKIQSTWMHLTGQQWHHIFGNKEAGEFLLNAVAQDPVITANLFKHMSKLGLKAGGSAENMAIMRIANHKAWHKFMRREGFEPWVKKGTESLESLKVQNKLAQQTKQGTKKEVLDRISKSTGELQPYKYTAPLDVSDYGKEIAKSIQRGDTDINELFTFLNVYYERTLPWMKKQLKDPKFRAEFLNELPEGPEKALLLGLYDTSKTVGRRSKP